MHGSEPVVPRELANIQRPCAASRCAGAARRNGECCWGEPIDGLLLTCGQYIAYWDGKDARTQQEVASGVYLYRLEASGSKPVVKKMLVSK